MLRQALRPAILLMNRMKFPYKLALLGVLFLCPVALLSVDLWNRLSTERAEALSKVEGVSTIQTLLSLQRASHQAANMLTLREVTASSEFSGLSQQAVAEVNQQLSALAALQSNTALLTDKDLSQLNALWKSSHETQLGNAYTVIADYYATYGQLAQEVGRLITKVADNSGLSTDGSSDIGALFTLMESSLAEPKSTFNLLHNYGLYSLQKSYLSTQAFQSVEDEFNAALDSQKLIKNRYQQFFEADGSQLSDAEQLLRHFQVLDDQIDTNIKLYDNNIVQDMGDKMNWKTYDGTFVELQNKFQSAEDTILALMKQQADVLMSATQQDRILFSVGMIALLGLITYLSLGMYFAMEDALNNVANCAREMASGNLNSQINVTSRDELGDMAHSFNSMADHVRGLIRVVTSNSESTAQSAHDVEILASQSNEMVRAQLEETRSINHSISAVTESSHDVAHEADHASEAAKIADQVAREGQVLVQDALKDFDALTKTIDQSTVMVENLALQSEGVTTILEVIKSIASQTNLLALNAAIEAARAGEQGRGFAVVADEVRTLAQRSHESTEEIDQVLGAIKNSVDQVVNSMSQSVKVTESAVNTTNAVDQQLGKIIEKVDVIVERAAAINHTAANQAQAVDRVKTSVNNIGSKATESAASAESTLGSVQTMKTAVQGLQSELKNFHI